MTIRHDVNGFEAARTPPVQSFDLQAKMFTLDEMIKRRASELQDAPLLGFPEAGVDDYKEHSAIAIDRYADAAVAKLQKMGLKSVVSISVFLMVIETYWCRILLLRRLLLLACSPNLVFTLSSRSSLLTGLDILRF